MARAAAGGLHLRSARIQQDSPDPDDGPKREALLACRREVALHPDELVLVFLDEMGYYRWPEPAADWGPAAPAPVPVAERAGPTNKQWRILGALNALTGQVTYRDAYRMGRDRVSAFYHQRVATYPHPRRLYVVQDNWSIHTHPEGLVTVERLPQVIPAWLPTYAPWLNPLEKLWRWLRTDVLRLHRLAGDWEVLPGWRLGGPARACERLSRPVCCGVRRLAALCGPPRSRPSGRGTTGRMITGFDRQNSLGAPQ